MNNIGLNEVLFSLILVALALSINRIWKIPVIKDMSIGSIRSFVQLIAVGYALEFIFELDNNWMILLALLVMLVVGGITAAGRIKNISQAKVITTSSILTGSFLTIGSMLLFDIISFEARYIIPLGGMIIGNSMNASALTVERIYSDLSSNRLAVESSLSLGKSWRKASALYIRQSATAGMISMLNSLKTVGLVALPGAMTGMILAGADPLDAVFLQIIVMYMLLMAVTITSVMSVELTVRKMFTKNHQLKL